MPNTLLIMVQQRGPQACSRLMSVLEFVNNSNFNKSIDEEEIKKYIPKFKKEVFLTQAYNNFVAVQNAWSEFDYKELRKLLTDELYNTYHSQLIALKAKNQKKISRTEHEKFHINRFSLI